METDKKILTVKQLKDFTDKKSGKIEYNSVTNMFKEIGGALTQINGILQNWDKIKGAVGQGNPTSDKPPHIGTKIEKGIDERMKGNPGTPQLAIHVGNASKDFKIFLQNLVQNMSDETTVKELKKQFADMNPDDFAIPVEAFLRKHVEIHYGK